MGNVRRLHCVGCKADLSAKPGPEFTAKGQRTKRLAAPDRVVITIEATLNSPTGKVHRHHALAFCPGCLSAERVRVACDTLFGRVV